MKGKSGRSGWLVVGLALGCVAGMAQSTVHGRKYKAPPTLAHIVVTVEKESNAKPVMNAAVVFRATKNGADSGNLEIKTDPDGQAIMDLIEADSHVMVQVIANGFATYAAEFDVTAADKNLLVKLQRPRSQVSIYAGGGNRPADVAPGTQEPQPPAPAGVKPAAPPAAGQSPAGPGAPPPVVTPEAPVVPAPSTGTPK
jgi:hypothetical protein